VLIVTRRRLLLALAFVVCVAVGMGFVLGRRTEQGLKQPLAHESEEAAGKTVTDEPHEAKRVADDIDTKRVATPDPLRDQGAPDLIPADKAVPDEAVPDEALIDEPVAEMIAIVPKVKMPIFYVDTKEPAVALTFDISWGQQQVLGVLQILREKNVKSTFFLSGPWAKRYPHLVQEISGAGHEIGSHGDAHVDLSRYSRDEVAENISTAHQDLLDSAGRVAPYFRPPNGDYDDVVVDTARSLGYETVIWAVDSLDWKNPGVDFMVDRVLGRTFAGAIVLMHASDSSQQIQDALPLIIDGLRDKGFRLVSLSELTRLGTPARRDPR
jgi:polysaccharide deacetylase family sporulation protein PdaB